MRGGILNDVRGIWALVSWLPLSLDCATIRPRPSGRGPSGCSCYETCNRPKTDGAGDLPSGERRADRKGDLLAIRDAQLAKSAPPRETEVGDFEKMT